MTTPSSAAALLSAHPLYDMWKENVAGYERIEGERKLTQTKKVKKKVSSCPLVTDLIEKKEKRISKIHTPQWRSPWQTQPHQRLDISSQSGTTPKARPSSTLVERLRIQDQDRMKCQGTKELIEVVSGCDSRGLTFVEVTRDGPETSSEQMNTFQFKKLLWELKKLSLGFYSRRLASRPITIRLADSATLHD